MHRPAGLITGRPPRYSEGKIASVPGMLTGVNDLVRLLRRIAITVAGTVVLVVGLVFLVTVLATMAYSIRESQRTEKAEQNQDAE